MLNRFIRQFIFFLILFFISTNFVIAAPFASPNEAFGDANTPSQPVTLNDPLGSHLTPQQMIGRIINSALGIVGSLALLMFIYGGFVWLTSAGSADKVTKGKNILVWATIGLAVIFMSYGATQFILEKVTGTK